MSFRKEIHSFFVKNRLSWAKEYERMVEKGENDTDEWLLEEET